MLVKKPSIKDIALETGVSATTVSIVMNGQGRERKISQKIIDEILEVADRMNYRPNQFAKGLRTGKTFTLGLIVDDISNFFFGHLAKSVEEAATGFGYTVMFCNTENDEKKAKNVLRKLVDRQMDGYIIAPTMGMLPDIRQLLLQQKPVVMIDRYFENLPGSYVTIDNYQGAFDSVRYLVENGYRKIALVTNETEQIQIQDRWRGYKDALQQLNIEFNEQFVAKIPFQISEDACVAAIEKFLKKQKQIDAILFTSNNLGIPGLESLRNLGKTVPEDVAVICFDDNDLFRLASPAISVVSQPIKSISQQAMALLLKQIEGGSFEQEHIVLPPQLIIRDSTPER